MSSSILLVFSCIIAVALAQGCSNCPPPQDPDIPCGPPDCRLPENHQNEALFPHPDPNFYYQCYPHSIAQGWIPIVRQCACGTVFNPHIFPRRCTFWWENTWYPICDWQSPPELAPCDPWCPDCGTTTTPLEDPTTSDEGTTTPENPGGGEPTTPGPITTTPGPITTTPGPITTTTSPNDDDPSEPTTRDPNECPGWPPCIPCSPCIWWPCWPCDPCWCNNVSSNNSRNPMSRQQYY
ncbi:hypothetical protein PVAND_001262 [Polypedilum vanderplanki]|uniref:Uncharacterized protein n=1 Tax=Polypedilum vanderplanki TaxID=319348 RepID=A0A9J6BMF5_POLVA|nr:hypothetical protein PVAND_001262 [Polypedilum vanderplanki]